MDYLELIFLAHLCARHARAAGTEDEVVTTLWRMAEVYRAAAAALGRAPDIGERQRNERQIAHLERFPIRRRLGF